MLAKQGWSSGTGLGAKKEGIVTPVESKLRPRAMGIGHGGFRERTDSNKREAIRSVSIFSPCSSLQTRRVDADLLLHILFSRRRGDEVDSDEERKKMRKSAAAREPVKGRRRADPLGGSYGEDSSSGTPSKDQQPWRKQKKVKIRVEHKTYEQIIAEAGENASVGGSGVGMIIDATGATVSAFLDPSSPLLALRLCRYDL